MKSVGPDFPLRRNLRAFPEISTSDFLLKNSTIHFNRIIVDYIASLMLYQAHTYTSTNKAFENTAYQQQHSQSFPSTISPRGLTNHGKEAAAL